MYKIKKYFQGVIKQGKMVRWPTSKQLMGYFAVVVSVVVGTESSPFFFLMSRPTNDNVTSAAKNIVLYIAMFI